MRDATEWCKVALDAEAADDWNRSLAAAKGSGATADVADDLDADERQFFESQLARRREWESALTSAGWRADPKAGWVPPDDGSEYADRASIARQLAELAVIDNRLARMRRADINAELQRARRNGVAL